MRKKTFEIHRQIITNVYQITVHDRNSMVHRWSCAHQRSIAITRKKILTIPNALIYIIRMSSSSGQVIYERLNGDWNQSYNFSNKYFKYMCLCEYDHIYPFNFDLRRSAARWKCGQYLIHTLRNAKSRRASIIVISTHIHSTPLNHTTQTYHDSHIARHSDQRWWWRRRHTMKWFVFSDPS